MPDDAALSVCTAELYDTHPQSFAVSEIQFRAFGLRRSFWGRATTLRTHEDHGPVLTALSEPGEGQVLVVDAGASLRVGVMGDRIASIAIRNGWAGVVILGAIRDSAAISGMAIGVRALGTTARRGWTPTEGKAGVPVALGTLVIAAGDWVYADEDAVMASKQRIDPAGAAPAPVCQGDR
ncbi:ribonuclease E activity regulator RraA [Nioella sp.]|uniref:ribonuclease E activity regulator RraA n=1 Tax=Nioella sp. TaxID=1912091 RepID=UPI0035153A96